MLEYDSVEDVVNFTASENQTPTITINLNRIIDKSLKHIVKDSKVWQEFHLNDSGKKRSFVLQFEKGQEFDEFFIKLSEVLSWLHACKKGKLSVDKKYYLVGFRDNPKEVITQISFDGNTDSEKRESFSSDSSENSTNDVIDSSFVTTAPFSPKPFNTLQTSRVIGLDKELSLGLLKRPKSEENKKGRYHEQIFGSMLQPVPPSGISIFETHSKHSNDSVLNYSVNKNGTVKQRNFCQSVNITEIDSNCDFCQTVDITQLDFDNNKSKGEAGNQRDVLNYSVNITELDLDKNGTVKHRDFCQTVDITQLDFDNNKLKGETCDQAQIKHSDDSDLIHSVNITELDLDKNGTVKRRDVCRSVNITEIHSNCDFRKTVDITQLEFDNNKSKGEAGNQRDVLIGDEVTDTTMKARQEQNQLKQCAQLLQAAINDGDQENARKYADILAASHLKIAITVDENSLKVEANSQDIKDCLKGAIVHNEEAFLQCPYNDGSYSCYASLQDKEIKAKSLSTAESQEMNSFHCKTPDCQGWCIYEDHVNFFKCPVCNKENCLTCKAIHEGVNCKKYQDDLQAQANDNAEDRRTRQMLNDMVKKGEAMHCPQCKVILQKKDGCDWLKCSICKTEICWVTKGPRWGPNGPGDITGGCRCRVNGEACHPECSNCH